MSAPRSSSRSWASPSANDARRNRVSHASSAASSAKRSSAKGSRSIAISVPPGPIRSATNRAWPPAPNVQSTAVCPGCGSSTSMSSPARTGMWLAVISASMTQALGDLLDLAGEGGVEVRPRLAVPDLDVVAGADDDDVLAQRGVIGEEARHADAAGAVELGIVRVGGEEGAESARLAGERVAALECGLHAPVEVLGRPQLDAG